jgi:hypothetical protein
MIPPLELAKTVHAIDSVATVIGTLGVVLLICILRGATIQDEAYKESCLLFISSLFKDAVRVSGYVASNYKIINE